MTAENSFMYVLPLTIVGAICLLYTRVLIARWVMQDVHRVDFSDPWQKWAVKVLFPKRPSGSEPRIISPGTHLALELKAYIIIVNSNVSTRCGKVNVHSQCRLIRR